MNFTSIFAFKSKLMEIINWRRCFIPEIWWGETAQVFVEYHNKMENFAFYLHITGLVCVYHVLPSTWGSSCCCSTVPPTSSLLWGACSSRSETILQSSRNIRISHFTIKHPHRWTGHFCVWDVGHFQERWQYASVTCLQIRYKIFLGGVNFLEGRRIKNIEVLVMKLVCLSRKFDCQHKISFFHFWEMMMALMISLDPDWVV